MNALLRTPAIPWLVGAALVGAVLAQSPPADRAKRFPATNLPGETGYAAGVWEEEMNGDLEAAIGKYGEKIVEYDAMRTSAAKAVHRLAEIYSRFGREAEARVQYERLLREFVDFPELTRGAQARLRETSSTPGGEPVRAPVIDRVTPEQVAGEPTVRELMLQELKLLESELAATEEQIKVGVASPGGLLPLRREMVQLQQRLAAADALERRAGRSSGDQRIERLPPSDPELAALEPLIQNEKSELRRTGAILDLVRSTSRPEALATKLVDDRRYEILKQEYEVVLAQPELNDKGLREGKARVIARMQTWLQDVFIPELETSLKFHEQRLAALRTEREELQARAAIGANHSSDGARGGRNKVEF